MRIGSACKRVVGQLVESRAAESGLHPLTYGSAHLKPLPFAWLSCRQSSGQAAGPSGQGAESEPPPEGPSAAATMGLMGLGAAGAIIVASVGAFGVLQMALMVAQGTGRSIMADKDSRGKQAVHASDVDRLQPMSKPDDKG